MKNPLSILFLLLFVCFFNVEGSATHNRAGEITYEHRPDIDEYAYEVTIFTCTDISISTNADREYMPIDWGHVIGPGSNTQDSILRTQEIIVVPNMTKANFYTTIHFFPGPGNYTLYTEDPNRNAGVNNIPGSVDQIFSITTKLILYNSPSLRFNNSVQLLNPPKEDGCVNRLWSHGVEAFDPDGDSLAFELIPNTGGNQLEVPGYVFPDQWPSVGQNGVMTFDQQFGILTWDVPLLTGFYNVAIKISEYRNGNLMGSVLRDMQIEIYTCANQPPVNNPLPDVCVVAGDDLVVQISSTDPEFDEVELSVEGEPFEISDAEFTIVNTDPPAGTMQWTPDCDEVRLAPYLVYVRSEELFTDPSLTDNDGFTITVIGPSIEGLQTEIQAGGNIQLSWEDYFCDNATGYKIFRRVGSNNYAPGFCETGLPESEGYSLIAQPFGAETISFLDTDPIFGEQVCYRVVACFEDGSESIVSDEVCDEIGIVIPIITHVSVGATDGVNGIDTLRWLAPVELDTLLAFTGPYNYRVLRAEGQSAEFEEIATTIPTSILDVGEIEYIDTGLDTEDVQYRYRVIFLNDGIDIAESNSASSVFLELAPSDESALLSWNFNVPWTNDSFDVFIQTPSATEFEYLTTIANLEYSATDLTNNEEYCFLVRSAGGYAASGYEGPFLNYSQEVCVIPFDNTPPCPPVLEISGTCEDGSYDVQWELDDTGCADDVAGFFIYYSPTIEGELEFLAEIDNPFATSLLSFEGPLYGCFAVSAYDSLSTRPDGSMASNESVLSEVICVESCPEYILPNVFSPNGDGVNDEFTPFMPYAYVDSIDLQIYNRWGNIIFKTSDPDIQWKGDNKDSGEFVSDGVYYYTIDIFEQTLQGLVPRSLSGYIHLFDHQLKTVE